VPWAEWRVGGVATQAMSNYLYGPRGLGLLRKGLDAETVVRRLTRADPGRDHRQLGVVDRRGRAAAWTGRKCIEYARHISGDGFSCQGNMLRADTVVPAMVNAYERSHGTLASRLLRAIQAGERAGGDKRGMTSAAMLVVHRERWMPATWSDHWVDLRVDRSSHPVRELGRLVRKDEAETRNYLRARARAARRRRRSTAP
jgi:uncharacterized Ntn-hydrolase superfamily protein